MKIHPLLLFSITCNCLAFAVIGWCIAESYWIGVVLNSVLHIPLFYSNLIAIKNE